MSAATPPVPCRNASLSIRPSRSAHPGRASACCVDGPIAQQVEGHVVRLGRPTTASACGCSMALSWPSPRPAPARRAGRRAACSWGSIHGTASFGAGRPTIATRSTRSRMPGGDGERDPAAGRPARDADRARPAHADRRSSATTTERMYSAMSSAACAMLGQLPGGQRVARAVAGPVDGDDVHVALGGRVGVGVEHRRAGRRMAEDHDALGVGVAEAGDADDAAGTEGERADSPCGPLCTRPPTRRSAHSPRAARDVHRPPRPPGDDGGSAVHVEPDRGGGVREGSSSTTAAPNAAGPRPSGSAAAANARRGARSPRRPQPTGVLRALKPVTIGAGRAARSITDIQTDSVQRTGRAASASSTGCSAAASCPARPSC